MPSLTTHTRQRPLRRALILAGCLAGSLPLVGLAASSAQAANNYWLTGSQNSVNANPENLILTAPAPGEESAQAVYRMSNTNYDQQLTNAGYNSTNPNTNSQNGHLGNVDALNNKTFDFSLEYKFGQGYIYTMKNNVSNNQYVTAWGTFSSPSLPTVGGSIISVNVAGTMGSPLEAPPGAGFNSISIYSSASANSGTTAQCNGSGPSVYSCVQLSNLAFTSSSLTQAGSGSWAPTTVASTGTTARGYQQLYSDVDLSTISWTLSGTVLEYKGSYGGDESVKMVINTRNVTFGTPAPSQPVPGPLPLLGATMALGWSRRLRHRMARAQSVAHQG